MKIVLIAFCVVFLAGCASPSRSHYDKFEKVQVDRMIGNEAHFSVFSRSVVCLNALREASFPEPVTNSAVNYVTNAIVSSLTNQVVTASNNEQHASQTNLVAASQGRAPGADIAAPDVPAPVPLLPPDSGAEGQTISTSSTESIATTPNQSVTSRSFQKVLLITEQTQANTSTNSLTAAKNRTITTETNIVITTSTNYTVFPVTNSTVVCAVKPVLTYYLATEISPSDFSLQNGESLVLLLDGVRHSFAPAQPQTSIKPRPGFVTTYYRVPAEVIVGIANARKVSMRIKGTSGLIECSLSHTARSNFRRFLIGRFGKKA